jgi:hypothetical protein
MERPMPSQEKEARKDSTATDIAKVIAGIVVLALAGISTYWYFIAWMWAFIIGLIVVVFALLIGWVTGPVQTIPVDLCQHCGSRWHSDCSNPLCR